jgi:putative addiction module antidote
MSDESKLTQADIDKAVKEALNAAKADWESEREAAEAGLKKKNQELLAKLHVEKGDTLYATESPDGVRLTPFDPAFEKQMEAARKIMKARRNVLHELAK